MGAPRQSLGQNCQPPFQISSLKHRLHHNSNKCCIAQCHLSENQKINCIDPRRANNTKLIIIEKKVKLIEAQSCQNSLQPHEPQPTRLLCPWDSPSKNTRVGSPSLFQGIFLIQGSNPGLLHCKHMLYCLSHQGSPNYYWVSPFKTTMTKKKKLKKNLPQKSDKPNMPLPYSRVSLQNKASSPSERCKVHLEAQIRLIIKVLILKSTEKTISQNALCISTYLKIISGSFFILRVTGYMKSLHGMIHSYLQQYFQQGLGPNDPSR